MEIACVANMAVSSFAAQSLLALTPKTAATQTMEIACVANMAVSSFAAQSLLALTPKTAATQTIMEIN